MKPDLHIYSFNYEPTGQRPYVDHEHPDNADNNDWDLFIGIEEGKIPIEHYQPVIFYVHKRDALSWDIYPGGGFHLISKRAKEIIYPFAQDYFRFLKAYINDQPYFIPDRTKDIDCLDRERSEFMTFADFRMTDPDRKRTITESDHYRIMEINKYRFKKERIDDPSMFSVPEINGAIFITESGVKAIESAGLKGFEFKLLD